MEGKRTAILGMSIATSILVTCTSANAQLKLPGGIGGVASGLTGGTLPGLASASVGNITGLLSYCVKNKIVSQMGAGGDVLAKLNGRADITQSPDYKAGIAGDLLGDKPSTVGSGGSAGMLGSLAGGGRKPLSLDSLPAELRTKACDAVLSRASGLL